MAKTLERTPQPIARGVAVEVAEENIAPWRGFTLAVKWSPKSGWWTEVARDDGGAYLVHADHVTTRGEDA